MFEKLFSISVSSYIGVSLMCHLVEETLFYMKGWRNRLGILKIFNCIS